MSDEIKIHEFQVPWSQPTFSNPDGSVRLGYCVVQKRPGKKDLLVMTYADGHPRRKVNGELMTRELEPEEAFTSVRDAPASVWRTVKAFVREICRGEGDNDFNKPIDYPPSHKWKCPL